ncbi:hypothetical protein NO995_07375 [Aestuariibaculum sp. M13]|uniref:hypothetical protein n=1 Tax=Aestuariibaculum sp. M13 TaxID=2967132 RepID=UPI002159EA43|nr:hypothetical protein [Aestuariibaculum sp. M13]MCR8667495.1 hypothetical protein [Aestuariibaculum sp. M13]
MLLKRTFFWGIIIFSNILLSCTKQDIDQDDTLITEFDVHATDPDDKPITPPND